MAPPSTKRQPLLTTYSQTDLRENQPSHWGWQQKPVGPNASLAPWFALLHNGDRTWGQYFRRFLEGLEIMVTSVIQTPTALRRDSTDRCTSSLHALLPAPAARSAPAGPLSSQAFLREGPRVYSPYTIYIRSWWQMTRSLRLPWQHSAATTANGSSSWHKKQAWLIMWEKQPSAVIGTDNMTQTPAHKYSWLAVHTSQRWPWIQTHLIHRNTI